jgi:hypothetical protein
MAFNLCQQRTNRKVGAAENLGDAISDAAQKLGIQLSQPLDTSISKATCDDASALIQY